MKWNVRTIVAIIAIGLSASIAGSSDAGIAHHHAGKLRPFDGGRIELQLAAEEESKLSIDGVVIRKTVHGDGGRGIVVQDVNAPIEACVRAIKSVERYTGVVPHVLEAEVYSEDTEADVSLRVDFCI